jgi:aminotransferase
VATPLVQNYVESNLLVRDRTSHRLRRTPPSGIRRFFDILATMPEVISLGIGEPNFVTPNHIIDAGVASLRAGHTGYTSNCGMIELRTLLSDYLAGLYGVRYDPKQEILITVGASEALHLAIMATIDAGDEVIIPEPCYVAYSACVAFAGGIPVAVPTYAQYNFEVTAEQIAAVVTPRTRAILINYPNNPTGAVMSHERLLEIANLAERYNLLVLSDEIYDRLVYGVEHTCFPTLPGMRDQTLLLGGFSKAFAMTGWRIGFVCGPADIMSGLHKIHQYIIMSAPTQAQYGGIAALTDPQTEKSVQAMIVEYDRRRRAVVDGLNQIGLDCFEPYGAFYAFPSVRRTGLTSEQFSEMLLLEEKVAVVPGNAFGASGEGYVRCSYTTSMQDIEEALHRMEHFVDRHS